MAEGTPIAKAYVQIRPDLSSFRDELRSGLQGETDGLTGTVKINADTSDFSAKIADTNAKVDDLDGKTASAKITVNDSDARAKITEVQTRIDELQTEAALIRVNVDDTQSKQQIKAIRDALDTIGNETLRPNVDPGRLEELNSDLDTLDVRLHNVGQDLDTTGTKLDNLKSKTDGAAKTFTGPSGLVTALIALSPALETVGAVGLGAFASFGVAIGSAAIGLGAFALAAKGSLTEVKGQVTDMYTAWQTATQGFTDAPIKTAVADLPTVFRLLTPAVATAGQALLGFENQQEQAFSTAAAREFSGYLAGEGGQAITTFGNLVIGLEHLFAGLAEGMSPEISRIEADVDKAAAAFSRWGQSASNGGLQSFIGYIQANGPLLAHTLEDIGTDFGILIKDAAPLGPLWLDVLDTVAKMVGALDQMNPELVEWGIGLGSVALAVNKLASPVGGIVAIPGIIGKIGEASAGGGAGLLGMGGAAAGLAGTIFTLGATVPAADIALAAIGGTLLTVTGQMNNFDSAAADAGKSWAQQFVSQLPAGTNAVAAVTGELSSLQGQMKATKEAAVGIEDAKVPFSDWNKPLDELPPKFTALAQLVESAGVAPTTKLSAAYDNLVNGPLANYGGKIDELNKLLPGLKQEQDAVDTATTNANTAMGVAAGYTGSAATQYGVLSGKLQQANQQLQQAETLLSTMLGSQLSAAQATTGFYGAVSNLTASLKTNHGAMDETTAAGLANHQALEQVGTSIISVISSMEKQGATSDQVRDKVHDLTGYIIDQAGKYGLTTQQVEAYLKQLGLTPDQVKTDIVLSGVQSASDKVAGFANQINHLPKNTVLQVQVAESFFQGIAQSAPGARSNTGSGVSGTNSLSRTSNDAVGGQINRSGRGFRASSAAVVGEDGSGYDEYVIPTNPAHRANALALTRGLLGELGMMAAGGILANQPTVTDDLTIDFGVTGGINNLSAWLSGVEGSATSKARADLQAQAAAQAAAAAAAGPVGAVSGSFAANQALGMQMAAARGWTGALWAALNQVEMMEAGWNPNAQNPTSSAYGIAQGITGPGWYYGYGGNPNTVAGQITGMYNYIAGRYGDPEGALQHELSQHWYATGGIIGGGGSGVPYKVLDTGGTIDPGLNMIYNGTGAPEIVPDPNATSTLATVTSALVTDDQALIAALLQLDKVTGQTTTAVGALASTIGGQLGAAVAAGTSAATSTSQFGASPVTITGTVGGGVTQTGPGAPITATTGATATAPSPLETTASALQQDLWQWNFTNGRTLPTSALSQLISQLGPAASDGVPFGYISSIEDTASRALAGGDSGPLAASLATQIQNLVNVIDGMTGHGTTVTVNDNRTVQVGAIASPQDVTDAINQANEQLIQALAVV